MRKKESINSIKKRVISGTVSDYVSKIVAFLNEKKFSSILEIGPGFCSTPMFIEYAKNNGSYVVSIENVQKWQKKLVEEYPTDNYHEIIFSEVVIEKDEQIKYDYNFNRMFDFVSIDGPGNLQGYKYYKRSMKDQLEPYDMKYYRLAVLQSSWVLDNIWDNIKVGACIFVDKRVSSVLYFLRKYKDKIIYRPLGQKANKIELKSVVKNGLTQKDIEISSCSLLIKVKK